MCIVEIEILNKDIIIGIVKMNFLLFFYCLIRFVLFDKIFLSKWKLLIKYF